MEGPRGQSGRQRREDEEEEEEGRSIDRLID